MSKLDNVYFIKQETEDIGNGEDYVEKYYRRKGYRVFNTNKPMKDLMLQEYGGEITEKDLLSKEEKLTREISQIISYKETGLPDLIVTNNLEIFFVEVKKDKDGIKREQLLWANNNPQRKVIYFFLKTKKLYCIVCGTTSTRHHSNHETGELEGFCEKHYKEVVE